jgi:hypothetical protein
MLHTPPPLQEHVWGNVAVYSENHPKAINTLCGHNAEFIFVFINLFVVYVKTISVTQAT